MPRFLDLVNHWIVEIFIITTTEEHTKERNRINEVLIGRLDKGEQVERSPRGVKRPDWFQDVTLDDIEQMAKIMPSRRRAP